MSDHHEWKPGDEVIRTWTDNHGSNCFGEKSRVKSVLRNGRVTIEGEGRRQYARRGGRLLDRRDDDGWTFSSTVWVLLDDTTKAEIEWCERVKKAEKICHRVGKCLLNAKGPAALSIQAIAEATALSMQAAAEAVLAAKGEQT